MPTITTAQNIDQVTFNNNEGFTVNNSGSLSINSDNYWAQAGKATGDVANYGTVTIDGRDVWWIPFDASSGNVPSLPTYNTNTVTVGGTAVGEFLGVWDVLGKTIPMVAGLAMPTTGYVKLRKKVGTIADNDVLTFANGATATVNSTTGGQRGWITIAAAGAAWQTWDKIATYNVLGDWFELGVADGTAGQQFRHYCFDAVPAVQVETGAGTGVYEWWCCVVTRANWTTTYFDTGDRSKNFDVTAEGLLTFNSGGTVGQRPPTGARIRVPNIHFLGYSTFGTGAAAIAGRQPAGTITVTLGSTSVTGTSTTFDSNLVGLRIYNTTGVLIGTVASVASTTSLTLVAGAAVAVTAGGYVIQQSILSRSLTPTGVSFFYRAESDLVMQNCTGQVRYTGGAKKVTIKNCATGAWGHNWTAYEAVFEDNAISAFSEVSGQRPLGITSSVPSGYVNSFKNIVITGFTTENIPTASIILTTFNATIENWRIIHKSAQFVNTITASYSTVKNCFFGKAVAEGSPVMTFAGTDLTVQNIDVAFGRIGSPATSGILGFNHSGLVENINNTFGNGAGAGVFQIGNTLGALIIRKIGTPTVKQNFGGSIVFTSSATPKELYMSEIYVTGYTVGFDNFTFNNYGLVFYRNELDGVTGLEPVIAFGTADNDWRRTYAAFSGGANYSVLPGTHRLELVNSKTTPTEITLWLWFQRPSFLDKSKLTMSASPGLVIPNFGFTSTFLETAGQYVINESYYYIKGITGFVNANPTVFRGSGAVTYSYDLDRGTGFTGTWKTATGANLSAETNISPTGLKLKVRAQVATSVVGTFASILQIRATTSTSAIANNKYGNKVVEHTVSGIQPGSVAYMFRTDTGALLAKTKEVTTGILSLYPEWTTNIPAIIRIRDQGYNTISPSFTMTFNGFNTPVTQLANTISTAIPGAWSITVTNHGASPVTWNSKQWSVTITSTGGQTAAEIAQFIHYWLNQDAGTFDSTLPNAAFHDLIIPSGVTSFETARGTVYGSAGAALKGVRVVDGSGNEIAGFARMQADDGTYYSPAASYTLTVSNIVTDSRILVRRTDTLAVIANQAVTTGSYVYTYTYTSDIPIEIIVRKATASPYYQEWRTTTTLSNSNNTQTANQLSDT